MTVAMVWCVWYCVCSRMFPSPRCLLGVCLFYSPENSDTMAQPTTKTVWWWWHRIWYAHTLQLSAGYRIYYVPSNNRTQLRTVTALWRYRKTTQHKIETWILPSIAWIRFRTRSIFSLASHAILGGLLAPLTCYFRGQFNFVTDFGSAFASRPNDWTGKIDEEIRKSFVLASSYMNFDDSRYNEWWVHNAQQ